MKALSQSEYGEIRSLYESMYASKEVITEELIDEIIDELVEELISEGVDEEEAYSLVEEATDTYIDEAKVTFGSDTAPIRKSGAPVGARRRYGMRKAGDALQGAKKAAGSAYKTAKSKAAGAAVDVAVASSMAKKKAGEVKKAAQEAPGKAKAAVTTAASDAKKKAKSGIKGFIKRQAQKVVSRMSEENEQLDEADSLAAMQARGEKVLAAQRKRKGTDEVDSLAAMQVRGEKVLAAQRKRKRREDNMKKEEYIDEMGKSDQGVRDRIAMFKNSKIEYTPPTNWDKDANRGKGATVSPKQAEKRRRKSLRQEELEATGLFSEKEIAAIEEAMSSYDRNRKRAAQRAADRNAARAAGKTGVVPGVGYVTPNKERETYTDEKGTVRHKSGAKNE